MPKSRKPTSNATPSPSQVQIESGARELQPAEEKKVSPQRVAHVPRFIESKDHTSVYANHVFFTVATIWDVRITFGEVMGQEDNRLVVQNRVSVTVPLAVAKMLALGIDANLQQLQKTTGRTVDLPGLDWAETQTGPDAKKPESKEPKEQK
jgi:hypothetical protein